MHKVHTHTHTERHMRVYFGNLFGSARSDGFDLCEFSYLCTGKIKHGQTSLQSQTFGPAGERQSQRESEREGEIQPGP